MEIAKEKSSDLRGLHVVDGDFSYTVMLILSICCEPICEVDLEVEHSFGLQCVFGTRTTRTNLFSPKQTFGMYLRK